MNLKNSFLFRALIGNMEMDEYERILPLARRDFSPLITVLMYFPPLENLPLAFLLAVLVIILYATYTFFLTCTCLLIMEDFVTWSEVIHHTLIIYLAMFINILVLLTKKNMLRATTKYFDGVFSYEEGLVDPVYKKIKDDNSKQQKRMFIVPFLIIFTGGVTLLIKPIMDISTGREYHPVLVENNVTMLSVIPIKYPYPVVETWELWVSNILMVIFCMFVLFTITTGDILFIRFASRIALELSILNESLLLIEKRVERLYIRTHGAKPPKKNRRDSSLYQECIEKCLTENIKHHHEIKQFYDDFAAVASSIIGGGFVACSAVMGLGMIIMNMDDVYLSDKIAFTGTVVAELLNAFMISWTSEMIGELNYDLYNAVYGVKWFNWSKRNKSTIIIFLDGTREPLFLTAFGLTKINMETFGTVVNTAYSFLNLVKASESLDK